MFRISLYALVCFGVFCGCSSSLGEWQRALEIDTIDRYELFLKTKANDPHSSDARNRVAALQVEVDSTNAERLELIKSYSSNQTTVERLKLDGWNWTDPYRRKYGFVEFIPGYPDTLTYAIGFYLGYTGDPEFVGEFDERAYGILENLATHAPIRAQRANDLPSPSVLCTAVFCSGKLDTLIWESDPSEHDGLRRR